jgi:hypothetical protein
MISLNIGDVVVALKRLFIASNVVLIVSSEVILNPSIPNFDNCLLYSSTTEGVFGLFEEIFDILILKSFPYNVEISMLYSSESLFNSIQPFP